MKKNYQNFWQFNKIIKKKPQNFQLSISVFFFYDVSMGNEMKTMLNYNEFFLYFANHY